MIYTYRIVEEQLGTGEMQYRVEKSIKVFGVTVIPWKTASYWNDGINTMAVFPDAHRAQRFCGILPSNTKFKQIVKEIAPPPTDITFTSDDFGKAFLTRGGETVIFHRADKERVYLIASGRYVTCDFCGVAYTNQNDDIIKRVSITSTIDEAYNWLIENAQSFDTSKEEERTALAEMLKTYLS